MQISLSKHSLERYEERVGPIGRLRELKKQVDTSQLLYRKKDSELRLMHQNYHNTIIVVVKRQGNTRTAVTFYPCTFDEALAHLHSGLRQVLEEIRISPLEKHNALKKREGKIRRLTYKLQALSAYTQNAAKAPHAPPEPANDAQRRNLPSR